MIHRRLSASARRRRSNSSILCHSWPLHQTVSASASSKSSCLYIPKRLIWLVVWSRTSSAALWPLVVDSAPPPPPPAILSTSKNAIVRSVSCSIFHQRQQRRRKRLKDGSDNDGTCNNKNRPSTTTSTATKEEADRRLQVSTTTKTEKKTMDSSNKKTDDDDEDVIGGGRINEKVRTQKGNVYSADGFEPSLVRSHLWHALEGFHRYPNYMSRWSDINDMDKFETALQTTLDNVREQKQTIITQRREMEQLIERLRRENPHRWDKLLTHPTDWTQVQEILDPAAVKAIFGSRLWKQQIINKNIQVSDVLLLSGNNNNNAVDIDLDVGSLETLMELEFPDVFSFPLLSKKFCKEICDYVQALAQLDNNNNNDTGKLGRRTNINLDTIGLSWINDLIFAIIMKPITRHLFATTECGGHNLDWRNGYVAGYSHQPFLNPTLTPREKLVTHTDDSEVTLNVCLNADDFEGGLLEFRGLRGSDDEGELLGTYTPQQGRAVIHAGRHFHHVTPVTAGNRFVYVLWARSWQGVRAQTCPCCWLNRRDAKQRTAAPCICGAQWN